MPVGFVPLLRDELGTIYDDTLFASLYPHDGQPVAAALKQREAGAFLLVCGRRVPAQSLVLLDVWVNRAVSQHR